MKTWKLVVIGILFLLATPKVRCQEVKTTRDIGVWAGVGVKIKPFKDWRASLTQEFRSFDDAIKLDRSITDLELSYKINKRFKLGGGLRYAHARKSDRTFINNIRYHVDFKYKKKIVKHFSLTYRFRFQHNHTHLFLDPSETRQRRSMRNRLKAEYKLEHHAVFFMAELFRQHVPYKKPSFNNLRLSLGDEINTGLGSFKYALACNYELNEDNPLHFYFLKLNYVIPLKNA